MRKKLLTAYPARILTPLILSLLTMGRLLQLLLRNGGFMTFLLVEALCFYLVVQHNTTQNAIFTHTTGIFAGNILEKRRGWADYLSLRHQRDSLMRENERLLADLAAIRMVQVPYRDTFFSVRFDTLYKGDTMLLRKISRPQYKFIAAKVIGNTINSVNNWLILNRGRNDSLRPDMGVVTGKGIVGIVRHVDPNFSMAMSVLHREVKISVSLKKERALGSLMWDGKDPSLMTLKYIPRHFKVKEGDEIVTSGYSELFPQGVPVGHIEGKIENDPENPYFWILNVRLSQDMSAVNNVYVVDNIYHTELDSLKQKVKQ